MTARRDDERLVSELTVDELVELIRQVVREEQANLATRDYFIDEDGRLAFQTEATYAAYLAKQAGRQPAEVNAYYLDARGRKAMYQAPLTSGEGEELARPAPRQPSEQRRPHPDYDIQTSDTDRHEAARRRLRGE